MARLVLQMGRSTVTVRLDAHDAVDREPLRPVTIAFGMPANERMDALVEKATELGAAAIQPLICERSVLRLTGERAVRRVQHWQQVAVAASEQSGRTRVPTVGAIQALPLWLAGLGHASRATCGASSSASTRMRGGAPTSCRMQRRRCSCSAGRRAA